MGKVDRRHADLPLDLRRLRNDDDFNHRRGGGYGRDHRRPSQKLLPDLFN